MAQSVLREPVLEWMPLSDAFEEGEPNLFSLLRWDYRLVDTLFGRDDDLRKILAWAENGSKTPSARLITGDGGVGKTRLGATAAQILRDRGWTAGFLPRLNAHIDIAVGSSGLFLIVDYPEEQPERTAALLAELAQRKTASYPLRVMFLSRRSFAQWEGETTILEGRFGRQAIAAPAPLGIEDGAQLIENAARNFAAGLQKPLPELRQSREWLKASPTQHCLPLYATAAAIHAVLSPKESFGLAGGELLKNLAFRELRRVHRTSEKLGIGHEALERLLALAVLADGLSESAVNGLTQAGICDGSSSDIVGVLARSPWWKNGCLARLEPDAPAAAFLDLALFGTPFPNGRDALPEWLFIALRDNAAGLGNRLARVLYDLHMLGARGGGLHPLDERLVEMLAKHPERAAYFVDIATSEVPFRTANFAALVARILASSVKEPEIKATFFNNGSTYLSLLGRREEALAAAQEAADIRRELARARPEAFTPDLAMSLNNLANRLSELGRREEALAAAQEAAALYRELARARPEAFTPNLVHRFHETYRMQGIHISNEAS